MEKPAAGERRFAAAMPPISAMRAWMLPVEYIVPTTGRREEIMQEISKKKCLSLAVCVTSYDLYAQEVRSLGSCQMRVKLREALNDQVCSCVA